MQVMYLYNYIIYFLLYFVLYYIYEVDDHLFKIHEAAQCRLPSWMWPTLRRNEVLTNLPPEFVCSSGWSASETEPLLVFVSLTDGAWTRFLYAVWTPIAIATPIIPTNGTISGVTHLLLQSENYDTINKVIYDKFVGGVKFTIDINKQRENINLKFEVMMFHINNIWWYCNK